MRSLILIGIVLFSSGCSGFVEHMAQADCMYIGCETGGLVIYDHEEFSYQKNSDVTFDENRRVIEKD